ncbi:glutaredoxin [Candidatus Aerophobetes bacterium]|uniref:Glutaredoxin n=1 Tax=Aerophobetes bacterium TaxID=2030807 RepID=A0A523UL28_UNCAE|nr:MAG: glutaredoxin [Candidatus Aerophobetes bacterium]
MALLKDEVRNEARERFKKLTDQVRLVNFTQKIECRYCEETRRLTEEIASLSPKISSKIYNFALDKEVSQQYKIDKIPALVVEGERNYGIRFFGIPGGYEFNSLISAIYDVSRRSTDLSLESKDRIGKIDKPIHIQVFVTLTCPYCPSAVEIAHRLALESEYITSDMIESAEFPHLVSKYGVMGVPKVVINEEFGFEGALPESSFVDEVMKASK